MHDILEKFGMSSSTPAATPLATNHGIHPDLTGDRADETFYRSMIGSLMYLVTTRISELIHVLNVTYVNLV